MISSNTTTSSINAMSTSFNPLNQTFAILAADGATEIPVPVAEVDELYTIALNTQINYGSQIGACFVMLLVVLAMTPQNRFARVPTLINTAALVIGVIRTVLLSLYFPSSWFEFYALVSGDYEFVAPRDYHISVVATVFAVPQLMLIEAALALQAWSMLRLWPDWLKWPVLFASAGVITVAVGFEAAAEAIQIKGILQGYDVKSVVWVRQVDLACTTTSISWFCFLFIVRLAMHMWTHRSILPSVKGLSAMEVLVMTNGVLMLVPVLFAGLEFGSYANFEPGSVVYTTVIIVLPLGTLVAQRLANPSAFLTPKQEHESGITSTTRGANSFRFGNGGSPSSGASRTPFLKNWSRHNTVSSTLTRRGSDEEVPGNGNKLTVKVESQRRDGAAHPRADAVDMELARIDEGDLEKGVRVDRAIERREEMI